MYRVEVFPTPPQTLLKGMPVGVGMVPLMAVATRPRVAPTSTAASRRQTRGALTTPVSHTHSHTHTHSPPRPLPPAPQAAAAAMTNYGQDASTYSSSSRTSYGSTATEPAYQQQGYAYDSTAYNQTPAGYDSQTGAT